MRALIVDDEPLAREGIRMRLGSQPDVEVVGECRNGREAVAAILRDAPDLVYLDIRMPRMDGFAVIEAVSIEARSASLSEGRVTACYLLRRT